MLKAKLLLKDTSERCIEEVEKKYFDLSVNNNEVFGGSVPIPVKQISTRIFTVRVTEVWFDNGETWLDEESDWHEIPNQTKLIDSYDKGKVEAFKYIYTQKAEYLPLVYKDMLFCSCGRCNNLSNEKCPACGVNLKEIQEVDFDVLGSQYI